MPIDAAIYARTSGFESESIRDQISICRRRCEERKWRVRYVLKDENESGGNPLRAGYQALWDHVEQQRIDVVVTWRIDRMARSLAEMSRLEESLRAAGVSLHSCTEPIDTTNAQGRFVYGVMASAGQLERELGSERITSILSERARRGMWMHAIAPFGYCLGKGRALRILTPEATTVKAVFEAFTSTGSYSEAAGALRRAGILRRGRPWTAGTVQRVIENSIHVGRYRHWRQEVVRPALRVISDELWEAAAAVRQRIPRAGVPASQDIKERAIERVFSQYLAGLDSLQDEPCMPPVR